MGDLPRAQAAQERALSITEKALGKDHSHVAVMLVNLGATRVARGDNPGARVVFERALAIQEKALGPDHPDVGRVLANLGGTIAALDDFAGAVPVLERGVAILQRALGPDHVLLVTALSELGRVRMSLGQLDAAQERLEQARAMSERIPGLSPLRKSPPLIGLGELYLARHEPAKAVSVLENVLGLGLVDVRGDTMLDLAEALWQVGKDRPRARSLAEEARAAYAHDGDKPAAAEAAKWLAKHPAPGR
jgi:serine/threonine-protein kinase